MEKIPVILICKNCGEQFNVERKEGNMPVNAIRLGADKCSMCARGLFNNKQARTYWLDKDGKEICDE